MPSPRRLHRTAVAALLASLVPGACSQATSNIPASESESVVEVPNSASASSQGGHTTALHIRSDNNTAEVTLDVSPAVAWRRLRLAYSTLQIPVTTLDSVRHLIGAKDVVVHDWLAGERMSRWLSCGQTSMGSLRADNYTVYLTALSEVRTATGGSVVRTVVSAGAQSPDGATNGVQCSSTGALEERIAGVVNPQ